MVWKKFIEIKPPVGFEVLFSDHEGAWTGRVEFIRNPQNLNPNYIVFSKDESGYFCFSYKQSAPIFWMFIPNTPDRERVPLSFWQRIKSLIQ